MINVGLVGYGNWGPNLLRNLIANSNYNFIGLAERLTNKAEVAKKLYPQIKIFESGQALIQDPSLQAVVIACKVEHHYSLAKEALEAGKHVLVEKPLCSTRNQALDLIKIAEDKNLTLMVDHTLLFDKAVQKIKNLFTRGQLGHVSYYDALRVNLGHFQPDVSVLWDLAPHDLAVMDYLFDEEPIKIQAGGYCHVNQNLNDIAFLTLYFASKRVAHFKFSWVHPVKQRVTIIGGDKKMLIWDDLAPEEKLKIYDTGLDFKRKTKTDIIIPSYRQGDVQSLWLEKVGALVGVTDHFANVILNKEKSLMDGHKGLRVLKILEEAENQINQNLQDVPLPM